MGLTDSRRCGLSIVGNGCTAVAMVQNQGGAGVFQKSGGLCGSFPASHDDYRAVRVGAGIVASD